MHGFYNLPYKIKLRLGVITRHPASGIRQAQDPACGLAASASLTILHTPQPNPFWNLTNIRVNR